MRRLFLLLIVIQMFGPAASALTPPAPFTCVANAAVPPTVPAEKLDALIGDVVLACTGGVPTAAGVAVPQVTLTMFLNAAVTSKVDGSTNSEALLLVDEPSQPAQAICLTPGLCAITGTGTGIGTYDGSAGRPNVFQGRVTGNQVQWTGIPIDPPGGNNVRVFRITNVRANAYGSSSGTIQTLLAASGAISVPINNPTNIAAFVTPGQTFSVRTSTGTPVNGIGFAQEASHNQALATGIAGSGCVDFRLRYAERFLTAFLLRNVAGGGAVTPIAQNVPGNIYNTETGFYNPQFPNLGGTGLGLADHGTRLIARFSNVPSGVRLYVSTAPVSSAGGMSAQLIATAADGSGAFSAVPGTGSIGASCPDITAGALAEVALTNGSGTAVWEITGANPLAAESVDFGVVTAWSPMPETGMSSVSGTYAPASTVFAADPSAPNPRFVTIAAASNMLAIAAAVVVPVLAADSIALAVLVCALGLIGAMTLFKTVRERDKCGKR